MTTRRRILSALSSLLLVLGVVTVAALGRPPAAGAAIPSAAPAGPRLDGSVRTSTPLLLIHGYGDSCAAFTSNGLDANDQGANSTDTVSYLTAHGFPDADIYRVGYYNVAWSLTTMSKGKHTYNDTTSEITLKDGTRVPPDCNANVHENTLATQTSGCHGANGGYTNDSIDYLACMMAWYIDDNFTSKGKAVNVVAHSMGGLVIRAALAYSGLAGHAGYPPHALLVSRIVTVGTPHGGITGLVGAIEGGANTTETADMEACPGLADTCSFAVGSMRTGGFIKGLIGAGTPRGGADALWMAMGSAIARPFDGGVLRHEQIPTDINEASGLTYPSTDFVVSTDSEVALDADFKIVYGSIEKTTSSVSVTDYPSGGVQYSHESNTCPDPVTDGFWKAVLAYAGLPNTEFCTAPPYYLNDASTGTTYAWTCTGTGLCGNTTDGINDVGLDPNNGNGHYGATPQLYSLAEIVHLLLDPPVSQTGHAAHADNDYPYAGMGVGGDEGVDGWSEYYGQCDSFAAWKVYENLGGTQHPSADQLPAVGWTPSDAKISPVVSYARQSSKAGTWGDAHDWIRSDQGLHAAPYFGIPVDGIPQPGSIAVWANAAEDPVHGIGTFGHVAYVTDVLDADDIVIEGFNLHGNEMYTTDVINRYSGGSDATFGRSMAFGWPTAFVHLGDGSNGPAQTPAQDQGIYPPSTYGPTSNSGGPSFSLAGSAYPKTVHGWHQQYGHGEIGEELYTFTHIGNADSTATWAPTLPHANACYEVDALVPDNYSNSDFALYRISDTRFGTSVVPVNENNFTNQFARLGVFETDGGGHLPVVLTDQGPPNATHQVAADAMRYIPQPNCSGLGRTALVLDHSTPGLTLAGQPYPPPPTTPVTPNGWYASPGKGLMGNQYYTFTNGATASSTATYTATLPAGCYEVDVFVPDNHSNSPAALYTITDGAFSTASLADVNENTFTNQFTGLGIFETRADGTISVQLTDQNPTGAYVAADAVKFTPASCSAVARWSQVVDSVRGPNFSTAGPTYGDGDTNGWYPNPGHGLRGDQLWTNAGGTTPSSTATWQPNVLAAGCYDIRAFIPANHADDPQAAYSVQLWNSQAGVGGPPVLVSQAAVGDAWADVGKFNLPAGYYFQVTLDDTGPTNSGALYVTADAMDFTRTTGC